MTITCPLRSLLIAALLATVAALPLGAEDSDAIAAFTQAFAGGDAAAKRAAMAPIIAMGRDADDTVYRLLVRAVNDPQTQDVAVLALRARCAQSPHPYDRGPSNPAYVPLDTPDDWNRWLALRSQYLERERALADISHRLAALTASTASAERPAPGSAVSAAGAERKPASAGTAPTSDLGRLSRIIFADGATVLGHVVDLHKDANGNVLSLEFIHRDGGGHEVIPIERIARIEDQP